MGEPAEELAVALPMELFDESMLPVRDDLVAMIGERSFLPSRVQPRGRTLIKRMLNDEELCEGICLALLSGLSVRLIGKRFGLSPKSVAAARDLMEERGELAPVRTRIQRRLDRVTELGLECVEDGLLNGEIHPGQAWIPALASVDKREQLSVGLVPGTERTRASVTVEQVRAEFALAAALLESSDSGSLANGKQAIDSQARDLPPAEPATGPATGTASPAAPSSPSRSAVPDGGGGVGSAPGGPRGRGDGAANFTP
jgi:hypothetical protein